MSVVGAVVLASRARALASRASHPRVFARARRRPIERDVPDVPVPVRSESAAPNRIITVIRPASTRGDDVDARDGRPRARQRARVALGASRALGVVRTRGGARVHQSDLAFSVGYGLAVAFGTAFVYAAHVASGAYTTTALAWHMAGGAAYGVRLATFLFVRSVAWAEWREQRKKAPRRRRRDF